MSDKRLNILEGIEKGISQSYLGGFNRIVGMDIDSAPGIVFPELRLRTEYPFVPEYTTEKTFTAATSDICTVASTTFEWLEGQSVTLSTTGTLPAGLAVDTIYYVMKDPDNNTKFTLADSLENLDDGVAVNITDTGTGTHTATAVAMTYIVKLLNFGTDLYALDNSGVIWIKSTLFGEAWVKIKGTTEVFTGMVIWKNYLLGITSSAIFAWGNILFPETAEWTAWDEASVPSLSNAIRPTLISSSEVLYIGNGYKLAFLMETVGQSFSPASAATYTFSSESSFSIPYWKTISSLAEYNNTCAIGCGRGGENDANIYFWDYVSDYFDTKLNVNLSWVDNMVATGGLLYFITSGSGRETDGIVYVTNGSSTKTAFKIPKAATNSQTLKTAYPFVINRYSFIEWNNKLLVGVSGSYGAGIYCYNLETGALDLRYTIGSGNEGATAQVRIYALLGLENDLKVGVRETTSDYTIQSLNSVTAPYRINTDSYGETGLMTVGTKDSPRTYEFFEIQLGKELATGEIITLYYRTNLTDSWTSIGTMSYTADGAIATKIIRNSTVRGDQIQFKVLTTCGSSATTGQEIKAIYVY